MEKGARSFRSGSAAIRARVANTMATTDVPYCDKECIDHRVPTMYDIFVAATLMSLWAGLGRRRNCRGVPGTSFYRQ